MKQPMRLACILVVAGACSVSPYRRIDGPVTQPNLPARIEAHFDPATRLATRKRTDGASIDSVIALHGTVVDLRSDTMFVEYDKIELVGDVVLRATGTAIVPQASVAWMKAYTVLSAEQIERAKRVDRVVQGLITIAGVALATYLLLHGTFDGPI